MSTALTRDDGYDRRSLAHLALSPVALTGCGAAERVGLRKTLPWVRRGETLLRVHETVPAYDVRRGDYLIVREGMVRARARRRER